MAVEKKSGSLDWLVAARGYAMYGVFFGHVGIAYIQAGYTSVIYFGQLAEAMFVPFFLLLVGAFYSPSKNSFASVIKFKFLQRIVPVYFYLLIVMPFVLIATLLGDNLLDLKFILGYLIGVPVFGWPAWFLIALFTSELCYFFLQPKLKSKRAKLIGSAVLYVVAWWVNTALNNTPAWTSYVALIFMWHAVFLFCSFFLLGSALRSYIIRMTRWSDYKVWALLLLSATIWAVCAYLNDFSEPVEGSVRKLFSQDMAIISIGQYGEFFPFLGSILFGSMTLLCVSRLLPVSNLMRLCGNYSLILLGLNCIFHTVLNKHIVALVPPIHDHWSMVFLTGVVVSFITMVACLPLAIILQKYFPQLIGKPMLAGPILPALYKKK